MAAPRRQDPAYFSRFGGLWTDRHDAGEEIKRRLDAGTITESDAERLDHWVAHGHVVLERGVEPEACDRLRADLDRSFADGDERLLMHSPGQATDDYRPLRAGVDTEGARVVDVYAFYESARAVLFSEPIVHFLRTVFDDAPLLFQSLTFEKGSEQDMHQDTAFVVTMSPLEFAASWIALEDIRPGSGELMYLDGSHRLPEYLFSGRYKHWNPKRDGEEQQAEWEDLMSRNAERMGLEKKTFLPKKGDVLIWSADLAHGGSPVSDPSLTRKSLVGHYCPNRVDPFDFKLHPERRGKGRFDGCFYASHYYPISA
jgi:phytanoyl-CoA hydroxylase